eukprot:scaffold4808_cov167-Cylindrotheca_fusiformis.AAC.1
MTAATRPRDGSCLPDVLWRQRQGSPNSADGAVRDTSHLRGSFIHGFQYSNITSEDHGTYRNLCHSASHEWPLDSTTN